MYFIVIALCLIELGMAAYYTREFFRTLPKMILAHLLMLAAILIYCAGGTLLAYVSLSQTELTGLLSWRHIGDEHIIFALILTLVFCVFVHWVAIRLAGRIGIPTAQAVSALDRLSLDPLAFGATSILILAAYGALVATGRVSFHGAQGQQATDSAGAESGADPLLMVMSLVLFLLPLLCGYRFLVRGKLLATLPVFAGSVVFALVQGRRDLIELLFFGVLGYALNRRLQITRAVKSVALASILGLAVLGFLVSVAVRMASSFSGRSATPAQVASLAYGMLTTGGQDKSTNVASATKDNVGTRAFNPILFLATLSSADREQSGVLGDIMVNGVELAVPGILWPQKELYVQTEEEIASASMHVPVSYDEAETIMSGAYNDFREPGLVVYGLFIIVMLMVSAFAVSRAHLPVFKLLLLTAILLTVLSTEAEIVSWFLLLRNIMALSLLDLFCQLFSSRQRVIRRPGTTSSRHLTPPASVRLDPALTFEHSPHQQR